MKKSKTNFVQKVYWERNMLALLLANKTDGSGWYCDENSKRNKRVISINHGQITFHVPDDFDLGDLPEIENDWDGHSSEEKWSRVRNLIIK
jgi:hypothetical protein